LINTVSWYDTFVKKEYLRTLEQMHAYVGGQSNPYTGANTSGTNLYPHLGRLGMAQLERAGVEQMDIWCSSKGDE
jgi:hypothetical protein